MTTDNKNVSKKKSSPKGRKWCFTSFKKEINWNKIYEEYNDIIRYLVVQGEITPTTKKFHWQGYIQLYNQSRMRKLKLLMGDMKVHLELAMGTAEDNKAYCTKIRSGTGQKFEFGKAVSQGYRSDNEAIRKCLKDGGSMWDVAESHFGTYIRYHRGYERYKQMCDKRNRKKQRDVKVEVISGPTGCGKSRYVFEKEEDVFEIDFENGTEWWDQYDGEKAILIEEYNNNLPITRILRLLDRYRCRLPVKGGFTYANWTRVYITTNLKKGEIHKNAKPEHQRALERRISKWTDKFTEVSQGVLGNTGSRTLVYEDSSSD